MYTYVLCETNVSNKNTLQRYISLYNVLFIGEIFKDFPPRNYNATICEIISTVQASSNCVDSKLLKF